MVNRPSTQLLTSNLLDVTSRINRALHKEGIRDVRVDRVRQSAGGRLLGTTTPSSTTQALLRLGDLVLRAARSVDSSISDLRPFER